jgi:hypothetical protein
LIADPAFPANIAGFGLSTRGFDVFPENMVGEYTHPTKLKFPLSTFACSTFSHSAVHAGSFTKFRAGKKHLL